MSCASITSYTSLNLLLDTLLHLVAIKHIDYALYNFTRNITELTAQLNTTFNYFMKISVILSINFHTHTYDAYSIERFPASSIDLLFVRSRSYFRFARLEEEIKNWFADFIMV